MHLSPYSLHCSVCNTELWDKCQWLQHLSTEKHQSLARELCVREWGSADETGVKIRKRCLLIFSSFPVPPSSQGAMKIIQHFSKKAGVFVTDFVCWEERPCLGVVQFESWKIVKAVFSGVTNAELVIDSQPVQIRLGMDFRHLEWSALFPFAIAPDAPSRPSLKRLVPPQQEDANSRLTSVLNDPASISVLKRVKLTTPGTPVKHFVKKFGSLKKTVAKFTQFVARQGWPPPEYQFRHFDGSSTKKTTWACTLKVNGVDYSTQFPNRKEFRHRMKKKAQLVAAFLCLQALRKEVARDKRKTSSLEKEADLAQRPSPEKEEPLPPLPSWTFDPNGTSIQDQFHKLRLSVTVPTGTYNTVLNIVHRLKTLFCAKNRNVVVVPFRNLHLKLTNPDWDSWNEVLIFCYSTKSGFTPLPHAVLYPVIKSAKFRHHFSVVKAPEKEASQEKLGGIYRCLKTEFTLATARRLIVEVQICRLLEYMITFDPRCHFLMTLTFYWTRVNGVSFGNLNLSNDVRHVILPEPLTMEWLVILFMCYRGLIPSVREIQQRPHTVVRDPGAGVDIGFEADSDYAQEWKSNKTRDDPSLPLEEDPTSEEFILSVLKLFQEFLEFYGETLDGGQWILNTRDGEVINIDQFLREDPGPASSWQTKMTPTDLFGLRTIQGGRSEKLFTKEPEAANSEESALIEYYSTCAFRVDYKGRTLYIVHPFNFTQIFSTQKELPQVLQLMGRSSRQLKNFLQAGLASAETLESVLIADKN